MAQPRGELAGLLTVGYPKTRIADMALEDDLHQRIDRVLVEQRQRDRIREHGAERRKEAEDAGIKVHGAVPGLYVEFESRPGVKLKLSSLEDARAGIELVAVTETKTDEAEPKRVQHATVFVPDGKVKHFVSRFEKYAQTAPKKKGERRHEEMIDPVATLRLATLRGLWTDAPDAYPTENESIWWEVWLRRHDGNELARLMEFASLQKLDVSERRLQFDERVEDGVPRPGGPHRHPAWRRQRADPRALRHWYNEFYKVETSVDLFGNALEKPIKEKMDTIGRYFNNRLKEVFAGVVEEPGVLRNSANNPLYLLCFAVGNERGKNIGLRIAEHLLKEVR